MLALDESGLLQPLSQRGDRLRKADFRRAPEKTDHRHRRLLRARRERPRYRRAAEERDEIAAFHCPVPPVLPIERIAQLNTAGDCFAAGFRLGL
jgi:hypothetical protein